MEWDRDVDGNIDTRHGELEVWLEDGLVLVEGAKRGATLCIHAQDLLRLVGELGE